MAAIVTDNLRLHQSELLLTEILADADSDRYYIGIGKSDVYSSTDAAVDPASPCILNTKPCKVAG